jgi:transglutaminase-like putative cysteine protease
MTTPTQLITNDPAAYLGADDVVQSGHPEIVRLAAELKGGARDDIAFAEAAYEWVRDQVTQARA